MGDVQIMQTTTTEVKKSKKVKKTSKRRESDVQITEIEQSQDEIEMGYVSFNGFLYFSTYFFTIYFLLNIINFILCTFKTIQKNAHKNQHVFFSKKYI